MADSESGYVVCVGELVVDMISTRLGEDIYEAESFKRCVGGNCTNVAVGLARLGSGVRLIGTIGEDFNGKFLLNRLSRESIDLQNVKQLTDFPTAQCYASRSKDDEPSYYNWPRPHAGDMFTGYDLSPAMFDDGRIMHCSGISLVYDPRRSAILQAMRMANERKIPVHFDATVPGDADPSVSKAAETAMQFADLVKVNTNELVFWLQDTDAAKPENLAAASMSLIHKHDLSALVVTLGSEGAFVKTRATECFSPALKVNPMCAIGAGDAFIAGLLHKLMDAGIHNVDDVTLLTKSQWLKVLDFANATGALSTQALGPVDHVITEADVLPLIAQSK